MKYLSVCSGIEAASVAWKPLGFKCIGLSEIEPFPSAVLKHRFPDVPNFGDMTKYREWPLKKGDFDILVGGTPCQAFSVAGLRKGLEDPRGNLTLVFLGMVDWFKPKYVVWENVPGVLSDKTGAFDALLSGLNEIGYVFDTDILDAQFFGVPQRRRRVFVTAINADYVNEMIRGNADERPADGELFSDAEIYGREPDKLREAACKIKALGDLADSGRRGAGALPAEREGLPGNTPQGEGAEQDAAAGTGGGSGSPELWTIDSIRSNSMRSANPDSGFHKADRAKTVETTGLNPQCNQGGQMVLDKSPVPTKFVLQDDVARTLDASYYKGTGARNGKEREMVVQLFAETADAVVSRYGTGGGKPRLCCRRRV